MRYSEWSGTLCKGYSLQTSYATLGACMHASCGECQMIVGIGWSSKVQS